MHRNGHATIRQPVFSSFLTFISNEDQTADADGSQDGEHDEPQVRQDFHNSSLLQGWHEPETTSFEQRLGGSVFDPLVGIAIM